MVVNILVEFSYLRKSSVLEFAKLPLLRITPSYSYRCGLSNFSSLFSQHLIFIPKYFTPCMISKFCLFITKVELWSGYGL